MEGNAFFLLRIYTFDAIHMGDEDTQLRQYQHATHCTIDSSWYVTVSDS